MQKTFKKIVAILAVVTMCLTMVICPVVQAAPVGDVNGDGSVNASDLANLKKLLAALISEDDPSVVNADLDKSGSVNAADLGMLKKILAGILIIEEEPDEDCKHNNLTKVAEKEATCSKEGNIAHWYCKDCKKYFSDANALTEIDKEKTVIETIPHTKVVDPAVAPTQTSTGLTEGTHCSVCKAVIVKQEVIPKLQGNYHSITYRNLNGAESPSITQYSESEGLPVDKMPVPEAAGYKFKGWYTASEGGQIVDYIEEGSTKNYVLFARWELITYTIRYFEAPDNDNVTTYTVEDEIYLSDPNWSGLGFVGWTEENDKIDIEIRSGRTYYKINPGTTGDLKVTANWKLMRNIAVQGTNTLMLAKYNPETEHYIFTYELGTIENVVLEELNSSTLGLYRHTGAGDFTLTMSQENTMEESFADSISQTISKSISTSSEWEQSKEWAKEISNEHSTHVDISLEIGGDAAMVKAGIETGYGYANTNTDSWGGGESHGGSYGEETENGQEIGSSFSYLKSITTSSEASITISGSSPHGYYDYVQAGNIRVFGVVTYNAKDGNVYMNTYSMLDNMHGIVLYYPDVNALNNPTCETLQYSIPRDNIGEVIANSYFVEYESEGGTGKMNKTLHTIGGVEKLLKNEFTKEGYIFTGWETRGKVEGQDGLVSTGTYTDEQIINTPLASNGNIVTMYAIWEKIDYTIEYQNTKPSTCSTQISTMPNNTACKYDEDVTLAEAPVLSGYTFDGWYFDSGCTDEHKLGDAGQLLEKANLTSESKGVVKAYPKWIPNTYTITFDTNGGTLKTTTMNVVFDKAYNYSSFVPTREGYIFLEWVLDDGTTPSDTGYWQTTENVTLTAKWLQTTATVTLRTGYKDANIRDDNINLVTDDDKVYDTINPNLDRQALIKKGYKKVRIKIKWEAYEEHDGNKDLWIRPYNNKTGAHMDHFECTATKGKWNTLSNTFIDINITDSGFSDTLAFIMEYGANGNQGDDWYLGDTIFQIEVIK